MNEAAVHDKYEFGFWVYLMTDLMMFAALFAAYAVLRFSNFGGPTESDVFNLPFVLAETLVLLTSSFTCGLGTLAVRAGKKNAVIGWFTATFILGATFLALELSEFSRLIAEGNGPQRSAFLSSYFTLVGTHGLHIAVGLLWIFLSVIYLSRRELTPAMTSKMARLALFWHFLDIVWIFIFTIVYLIGVI